METLRHNSTAAHDSLYMTGLLLIQLLGCLLSKPYISIGRAPTVTCSDAVAPTSSERHKCACTDQALSRLRIDTSLTK